MKISQSTLDFVCRHANDDVRKLALSAKRTEDLDLTFALDQIAGRQMARTKLPSWLAMADEVSKENMDEAHFLVFPPHISMEQCSSEQTAKYKKSALARLLNRVLDQVGASENTPDKTAINAHFIDVTGGFGVDFSYLAQGFAEATYVERQEHLCEIAKHNFPLLGLPQAQVVCKELESPLELLSEMGLTADLQRTYNGPTANPKKNENRAVLGSQKPVVIFIDPARRDTNGNRTYAIADCTPDILGFIGELLQQVALVMVRLSPMLDWHQTVEELNRASKSGDAVREVHVVSTQNECKELLVVLSERFEGELVVHCVNDNEAFVFNPHNLSTSQPSNLSTLQPQYLFVPNASIMKAGCFGELENRFSVRQIGRNSHLFLGEKTHGFPGRVFEIVCCTSMNKKELKQAMTGIESANISTRNFPLSPEQLRKRLKIKDGGDVYLFATTTDDGNHIIYVTRKA